MTKNSRIDCALRSNGTNIFNPLTPSQRALSDEVMAYFTAFIATGNPNPPASSSSDAQETLANAPNAQKHISPIWPAHDTGKRLVFRAEGGGAGVARGTPGGSYVEELDAGEVERCKVWDKLADVIQL